MSTSSIDLFQLSPLPMWILENDTDRFLEVNVAAVQFYGYSREEFLSMRLEDVSRGEIETNLDKQIHVHVLKDRGLVYTHMIAQPIVYKQKPASLSMISDYTKSVESEKRLKESAERFSIVSKATSDTIWDFHIATDKMVWNRGIKGVFGHKEIEDDTTGVEWWYDNIHPDDVTRVRKKIERHIKDGIYRWRDEYRFRCGDGTYKHVFDRGFLVLDDTGTPVRVIGAMEDVTERKLYIQAIEDQNKKFKEIAWIQSHMVRAPLARIMALVDLIRIEPTDDDYQEMLDYLSSSARELDSVIVNIADRTPVS